MFVVGTRCCDDARGHDNRDGMYSEFVFCCVRDRCVVEFQAIVFTWMTMFDIIGCDRGCGM